MKSQQQRAILEIALMYQVEISYRYIDCHSLTYIQWKQVFEIVCLFVFQKHGSISQAEMVIRKNRKKEITNPQSQIKVQNNIIQLKILDCSV